VVPPSAVVVPPVVVPPPAVVVPPVVVPPPAVVASLSKPDFLADFVGVTFPSGDGSYSSPNPPGTWYVQQKAPGRISVIDAPGGVGGKCLSLHTEPGDNNIAGSGANNRADATLAMPGSLPGQPWQIEQTMAAGAYEGSERWYAHSVYFPSNGYNPPRLPNGWSSTMDFHGHAASWPQPIQLEMTPSAGGFRFFGGGGDGGQVRWSKIISPEPLRDFWYDFVYHIKWTSTTAGFIHIWMNGQLLHKQDNQPTLWTNDSAYLKLANYHADEGVPSTVCHRRIRIGRTPDSVSLGPLEGVLTLVNGVLTPL
jgi:hypothetical protein